MKKSLAIASAAACLIIGAVALRAASESVTVEDAVSTERILDLAALGQDKIATPEGRPVILAAHQIHPQSHEHGEETFYVRCESWDYNRRECYVGTNRPIYHTDVHHQLSNAACTRGVTWGFDGHSIWVSNGCRAEFIVRTLGGGGGGGGGRSVERQIYCESSHDHHYNSCWTGLQSIRDAYAHQVSHAPCRRGMSWGVDGSSIWVDHGCRAHFTVYGYERW